MGPRGRKIGRALHMAGFFPGKTCLPLCENILWWFEWCGICFGGFVRVWWVFECRSFEGSRHDLWDIGNFRGCCVVQCFMIIHV